MVAVCASRFSDTSHRRNQDDGRSTSANYRPNGHNNSFRRSPDAQRPSGRTSSNYGASRDHNPWFYNSHSGIQENDKIDRINRNNDFQHGYPSVLDRYNYTINKTHLVSSGQEFARIDNFGISKFDGIGNIYNFTNLSTPVSSAAGNHRDYQHAQRMGGSSYGPYQGYPRFAGYDGKPNIQTFIIQTLALFLPHYLLYLCHHLLMHIHQVFHLYIVYKIVVNLYIIPML